jgi:hypothetical protein
VSSDDQPRDLSLQEPDCPPGWATGPPDFVGIGAQRCGTSWWYRDALRAHPRVVLPPGRSKEIHFFDRYSADEVERDFAARYARFFPRPEGSISGEWTPDYMCAPWTPSLLAEAAPDARYLIMLRDPVERFRSGVAPVLKRLRESRNDVLNPMVVGDGILHSMYHRQVRRAFEILGRDRVLVLQYERCVEEPLSQMQRTQEFLGLEAVDAVPRASAAWERSREKPALPAQVRAELASMLAEDVRQVAALCPELDIGLWPNFARL